MKKNILIYMLILFSLGITKAQTLQPSEQAKGYLESKNAMVDYSTGIFHYSIPLFNLKVKGYKLPVALNYTGNGVKPGDLAGIIGKNWNLLVGGVITKTIRSGPYNEETDIYSLVINNNTVHFLLVGTNQIQPLEKTNVRIRYNKDNDTWLVTDENGIKYYFDAREITKNGCVEQIVSTQNIDHFEYTSSWYPTRISVPNGENIYFKYSVPYNGKNARLIDSTSYVSGALNRFIYGRPMIMWPFDFRSCKADFEKALDDAYKAARYEYDQSRISATISILDIRTGEIYTNPTYDAQLENLKMQRQVMGIITDMHEVAGISKELFDLLNDMIRYYGVSSTPAMYLERAKGILDRMARRTIELPSMQRPAYTMYTIMPLYLEKIQFEGQEIIFQYDTHISFASRSRVLKEIVFQDQLRQKTQKIKFTNQKDLLKQITWIDRNNSVIKNYDFSYYYESNSMSGSSSSLHLQSDYWGYYSNINSSQQDSVLSYLPDNTYAKTHSLQKIITPKKGEIEVEYELNRHGGNGNNDKFGGIRLKHLVLKNNEGNVDSVKYYYPGSAHLLYDGYLTHEIVNYPSGLRDLVIKSKAKFKGNAYINYGNNGIIYDYVIEEFKGKGYNSYLFCVPKPSSLQPQNTYPFWLCGLPLAKATYNKDGNLVMLQKMKYFTDMTYCNINLPKGDWFYKGEEAFNYSKNIHQRKVSEYYMNKGEVKSEYESYEKTLIYNDPSGFGVLYYDPMESYYINIEPRTNAFDSEAPYSLYYGGKTLLKEQVTYQFSGKASTALDKTHLTGILPSGYYLVDKLEYVYDTLNVSPIGIKSIQSNGDEEVTLWKNALCFQKGVNTIIDKMRDSNYFVPVKQLKLVREAGKSDYTLISESVTNYIDTVLPSSARTFLPGKSVIYKGGTLSYPANKINAPEQSLFSTTSSNYMIETEARYKLTDNKYLLAAKETIEGQNALYHGKERGQNILEVKNTNHDFAAATDTYRWSLENQSLVSNVQHLDSLHGELALYIQITDGLPLISLPAAASSYFKSMSFKRINVFLKMMKDCKEHYTNVLDLADSVRYFSIPDMKAALDTLNLPREFVTYLSPLLPILYSFSKITPMEYDALSLALNGGLPQITKTENLTVKVDALHQLFDVVLLLNPSQTSLSLNYRISKGTTGYSGTKNVQNLIQGRWQLVTFSLDAGEITGASSLDVSIPLVGKGISLAIIVPKYAIYDAVAYNPDGSILCKFNQLGEMQLQEYDVANRPMKVKDQSGDIIKEYQYNYSKKDEIF